jgi:hypothetical protein
VIDARLGGSHHTRAQEQLIVVKSRLEELALGSRHDEQDAFCFEIAMRLASEAQQLSSTALKVLEESSMVNIAHGVTFGVTGPDFDLAHRQLVRFSHRRFKP